MKARQSLAIAVALALSLGKAAAGEPVSWTLDSCINYALQHNISLQQSYLSAESAAADVKSARAALFPNLSFSTSHNLINRPFQETSTTVSGTEILQSNSSTSYNGSYGLNASWTLFNGLSGRNSLKQSQINEQVSLLDAQANEQTIVEEIVQNYIQILYARESVGVNENTLETSMAQRDRGRELYNAGSISKSDLAQLESQVSSDRYQLVTSQSTLQTYTLQLKQLLEITDDLEMDLFIPEIDDSQVLSIVPDKQAVYAAALGSRAEIRSSELSLDASELAVKIARAGYYPSLSLSAGTGTSHTSGTDFTFGEQVKNGWNNSIGLSLNVPIFSNRQTKSAVERARIQQRNSELSLQQEQKNLYMTVEGLWLDAVNCQQQYIAAKDNVESAGTSFELCSERFSLGMANTVELLQEKNDYLSAQQQMLQAKYMAVLSRVLLNYYAGEPMSI